MIPNLHFTTDQIFFHQGDPSDRHAGQNRIIAGGWGSPFEFLISVGESE